MIGSVKWKRHLGRRVRLHMVDGPSVEGRLVFAARRFLELADAAIVVDGSVSPLEGVTVVEAVLFGQVLDDAG